ncbi:hypothetical protein CAOG_002865 [Capsaspora owczarzaki ATCC 30864]|uniref:Secreted protein n=2 Tax=Capsaspora owczarzaki (strain ATCC 30864) TaxID=595528 RepID=A0A0D2U9M5_CAPO3|nr:hypothetical protein CAOG_002865 [Capsaspora owczarzaki ATCC 30864]
MLRALGLLALFAVAAATALPLSSDYVLTPAGYQHSSCVHGVPAGSEVVRSDEGLTLIHPDGTIIRKDKCSYPTFNSMREVKQAAAAGGAVGGNRVLINDDGNVEETANGWQAYTKQNAGNVTAYLGTFNIPAAPQDYNGQTIFFFTGLQNIDWVPPQTRPSEGFDIIQPVAQYGPSSAGGGNYWTLSSWYVTLGTGTVWSPLIRINANDTIFGNMTRTGPESWYINSLDQTLNQKTDITVTKSLLTTQPWIYNTLEVYELSKCTHFPAAPNNVLNFRNLALYVSGQLTSANWQIGTDGQNPPLCSAVAKINSPVSVDIVF